MHKTYACGVADCHGRSNRQRSESGVLDVDRMTHAMWSFSICSHVWYMRHARGALYVSRLPSAVHPLLECQ